MANLIASCAVKRLFSSNARPLLLSSRIAAPISLSKDPSFQPYVPKRSFFKKSIPPDSIAPVLFAIGVVGTALGLNVYLTRKENKYSDPSYYPVYQELVPCCYKIRDFIMTANALVVFVNQMGSVSIPEIICLPLI